jgi:hypothetical protein
MTSCALGYGAGAGYFAAFLAAMPVAPQCPDARGYLCEYMLIPSISESSAEMWEILHTSLFLTPDMLTALLGVSFVLGLVLTILALPGLASRMIWSRGVPLKLTEESLAAQEAALRRELEDELLSAMPDPSSPDLNTSDPNAPDFTAPAFDYAPGPHVQEANAPEPNAPEPNAPESNAPEPNAPEPNFDPPSDGVQDAPHADKAAAAEGEHPTAQGEEGPATPLSRGPGSTGGSSEASASAREAATAAPLLITSLVGALSWFLSTRLVHCSLKTSQLSLTAVVAVFFYLVTSFLLFCVFTGGFICVCLILSEEWCFDHSIQTALPEAAVAAAAAVAALTAAAGRPLASERLARVLAAIALALGLLSLALGLRSSIRFNVSHYRTSYVVGMALADLAKVGSYAGVYRLSLGLRALHAGERAASQTLLESGFTPSHHSPTARTSRSGWNTHSHRSPNLRTPRSRMNTPSHRSPTARTPTRTPRSGMVTSGHLDAPIGQLVRSMTLVELKTRSVAGSGRHRLYKLRRAVGRRLGLHDGASLAWLDAAVFLIVYGLLFGLSDRINLALIALVGLYTTLLMLHDLDREIQFSVWGGAPSHAASTWDRGVAHFRGGDERVRAARWLWCAFAVRLLSIVTTAIMEPMCLHQPCVAHQTACPLPYHLNHLSVGYSLDFVTVALIMAGTLSLIADEHRQAHLSHSTHKEAAGTDAS